MLMAPPVQAPPAAHSALQADLGMTVAELRGRFGRRLQWDRASRIYWIERYVDDGQTWDAELKFSPRSHRLVKLNLSIEGEAACRKANDRLRQRYGKPIDQDLVSQHSYALWRDPKTRLFVDYTGLDDGPYHTCWKSYSVTRQE
jgi:hypothetical protein